MSNTNKEISSVVKIDPCLLEKIDNFIKKGENRLKFSNKKQFVDIAVYEYLEKFKNGDKK
jgi:hypothetical protein